ncbi:hypothetical protein ABVT39_015819 [Epinephelus coioides]
MQTMTFAIKEINQRSDLLPQLKLGFHIRDSCDDIPVSLRASLLLVNGQPETGTRVESVNRDKGLKRNNTSNLGCVAVQSTVSPVIIGDAASGVSIALLRSLGSFHIPLVSYFASCSCLSNQREFPTFMRTMPSDAFQIKALAQLVSYFGWTWVGVIGLESDYARFAIQLFLQESVHYGVCTAYTHFYPVVLSQQALDNDSEMKGILREVQRRNITGLQWIASEAWATASSLWEKFGDLLTGTLGFAIRRADVIPELEQYLSSLRPSNIHESAFLTEFWEELFNCRLNGSMNDHSHGGDNYLDRLPCKGTENLNDVYSPYYDVTQLRVSYNVYKAVYVVAHALQDMSDCIIGQGPFLNGACADPKNVQPWQVRLLIHYMKRVNFSALGEKVNFDQNGDPIAYYDLLNWQRRPDGSLHLVKVGFYDASSSGRSLVINDSVIQWPVGKQTMTFAIKEINQRSDLLPQLKLGFHIRDSCDDIPVSLRASLLLVNGQPETGTRVESVNRDKGLKRNSTSNLSCAAVQSTVSPVIIGDAASGVSVALLRSLGSFHIPLVSYFASCSCLSNQREFPTFMRTMPSDAFQIKALAQLVSYFGWTWVGVIGVETDYARFAIQLFLQESVQYGVCSAYTHFYPVVLSQQALDELLDVIQMSSSKVIINFSSESEMEVILREIRHRNITGLQWIASEAWATAKSLWEKFGDLLTGTLGFAIRRADVIPGLKQHLAGLRPSNIHESAFLTEFWEELFNCRLNRSINVHSHGGDNYLDRLPCKGTENLNDVYSPYYDVTQLRVSYNVYKAVYVVAHALQDMSNCKIGQGPFLNGACADTKTVKPWQLMHYMKHVNFSALGEKVNFDHNGDPIAYYDLLNWQRRPDESLHLVKVGFYDASSPGRSLLINDSVIQWPVGKQTLSTPSPHTAAEEPVGDDDEALFAHPLWQSTPVKPKVRLAPHWSHQTDLQAQTELDSMEHSFVHDVSMSLIQSDAKDPSFVVPSSTSTSTPTSEENEEIGTWQEKKWLVNQSRLMQLFETRHQCGGGIMEPSISSAGSLIRIKWDCQNGHSGLWSSCCDVRGMPKKNLLVAASTLLTGATYTTIADWAELLNIQLSKKFTFYSIQSSYLIPVIDIKYNEQHKAIMERLLQTQYVVKEGVHVSGDGRSDR